MDPEEYRGPDDDLLSYLEYNPADTYQPEDILHLWAALAGHNDENYWYWVIQLKDGRFFLVIAWCDYTGWSCNSGGEDWLATSAEDAALQAPETEAGRLIRWNLLRQVREEAPYGLEYTAKE